MFRIIKALKGLLALIAVAGLLSILAAGPAQARTGQSGPGAAPVQQATAVTLYGLTTANKMLRFTSDAPATIQSEVQITGIQPDENILGIDFRPATGQLYGLGSTSRLYTIDPASGAAAPVGTTVLSPTISGTDFGFDFNPLVDRVRVTSASGQNLRLNPNNGAVAAVDGTLVFTTTDRNVGATPHVVGSAYTNNVPGPASTVLYNIDSTLDVLVIQNPPNNGVLNTVGSLGVDTTSLVGFDILGSNMAYASLTVAGEGSKLYMIDLATGAATAVGAIGTDQQIRGLTGALTAAPATVTPAPTTTATTIPANTATVTPMNTPTTAPMDTPTMMPVVNTPTTAPMSTPTTMPVVNTPTSVPMEPLPTTTMVPPGMPTTGAVESNLGLYVLGLLGACLVTCGLLIQGRRRKAGSRS